MYNYVEDLRNVFLMKIKKNQTSNSLMVEYEWSDRDGCFNITTTEGCSKKIKNNMIRNKKFVIKNDDYDLDICIKNDSLLYKSSSAGGKTKIKSDLINQFCDNLFKSKSKLENEVKRLYKATLESYLTIVIHYLV